MRTGAGCGLLSPHKVRGAKRLVRSGDFCLLSMNHASLMEAARWQGRAHHRHCERPVWAWFAAYA